MEWRCEWCGKPHEEDDPPCDNCGHGSFERAVVRRTDLSTDGPEATRMWVCTACGREHTKHSPPCSRCGAADLELREVSVDDDELASRGYRDLLSPFYLVALVVAVLLAVLLFLGLTGAVDVPGFGGGDIPAVSDVPGNATHADGVSLAAVEAAYLDAQRERLDAETRATLDRDGTLDDLARYVNQRQVKQLLADGDPPDSELVFETVERTCEGDQFGTLPLTIDPGEARTASALGAAFADAYAGADATVSGERTGVDVHRLPDGRLVLWQLYC